MPTSSVRKYLAKLFRIVLWIFTSVLIILLIVLISLQFPVVQTYLTDKITSRLSSLTGTDIRVEKVAIRFPKSIGLRGIYVEDSGGDTLLYAGSIYADIRMTALLRNRIHVSRLELEELTAFIVREKPDSVFNFQFIADAFGTAQPEENQSAQNESSLEFRLNSIVLEKINLHFKDHHSGLQMGAILDHFSTNLGNSDLLNQQYHVGLTEISGGHLEFFMTEPTYPPEPADAEGNYPDISLASLNLRNFSFLFHNNDGAYMDIKTSLLDIIPEKINLSDNIINISSFRTENLHASIIQPGDGDSVTVNTEVADIEKDLPGDMDFEFDFSNIMEWTVSLGQVDIINSYISIAEESTLPASDEFDPGNFSLGDLNLSGSNIYAAPDSINIGIDNLSMIISDKFPVSMLSLDLNFGSREGSVKMDLMTAKSQVELEFYTEANLLSFSRDLLFESHFEIVLGRNIINEDISFFIPEIKSWYFSRPETEGIEFGGSVHGTLAHISADSLRIEGPGVFSVYAEGEISGYGTDSLYLDMGLVSLFATPEELFANLPDTLRPEGITLPEYFNLTGNFKGTTELFDTDLEFRSNFGNIAATVSMHKQPGQEALFEGEIITGSFDIGHMMQLEILPLPIGFDLNFAGRGTDPVDMEVESEIILSNLSLNGYTYQDIEMNLRLKDSVVFITSGYADEFLVMDIDAEIGLFTETLFTKGGINIGHADLFQLGISDEELLIATEIEADIIFEPEDFLNGEIKISNTRIAASDNVNRIDDILVQSVSRSGYYQFGLNMEFMTAEYIGNLSPFDIPGIISDHLSGYFNSTDTIEAPVERNEYFELNLSIFPDDRMTMIIEDIESYDTLTINVNYDSRLYAISLDAVLNNFQTSSIKVSNFLAQAVSYPAGMDFMISADSLSFNEADLYYFDLSGGFIDKVLDLTLAFKDSEEIDLVYIGAAIERLQELYHIRLDSDKLIINREEWAVNPENLTIVGDGYLLISDLRLENRESLLSVNSISTEEHDTALEVIFREIDLNSITGFLENGIPSFAGIINGNVIIREIFSGPSFTAEIVIDSLAISDNIIGTLNLTAENPTRGNYYIMASAIHEGTELRVEGTYDGEEQAFDIDILLDKLNLELAENFTGGNITHLNGIITGKIHLGGTSDNPEISGDLNINETGFRVPALNTGYFLRDETISFDNQNIVFHNFILEDSLGRKAMLQGNVNFSDFNNFIFNLDLSTRDFLLMDLAQRRGEMYYGRILMDSDLSLRGSHLGPSVEGRLKLNEGSAFTFSLPQDDPEAVGAEGIVEFTQPDDSLFPVMAARTDELIAPVEMMNINLNIEIDRATILRLIIDDLAGDFLEVQGGGLLNFGIDQGGEISLSGRYEIDEGQYLLTFYDIIKRNFDIEPGSSIIWTGDPLDARLDITAIYTIQTNVQELMRTHADQAQSASLRQQYPFLVSLSMADNLMNPNISFGLDMPPEARNAMDGAIMQRIDEINQNESELNKQVFALLILGNFIQENPLDFAGGSGISGTARSSGSQILTQQLNRMSDRYIRGLDISFELESYEDFSDGEATGRTELQMEVSRNFFDERFRVTVGGNIELEDETRRETSAADIAGDFSLEYLLTPEGNFILRGYRNRNYGDLIERDVIETGISLKFSKSYNRFREIFARRIENPMLPEPETN